MTLEDMICEYCAEYVLGDPRYHEVYNNGKLVGVRHRICNPNA